MCHAHDCQIPTTLSSSTIKRRHIFQNVLLVWLHADIDDFNDDYHSSTTELQRVVNTIHKFDNVDQCVNFLADVQDEKVFMLIHYAHSSYIIPLIHEAPQLHSIYLYDRNQSGHGSCASTTQWPKIKGTFAHIGSICKSLKQATRQLDRNLIPISLFPLDEINVNRNLAEIDPSFMYTMLLKEILDDIEYTPESIQHLTGYCRDQYAGNDYLFSTIDRFEREYYDKSPIWWYTSENFLYTMLNSSLRAQDVDAMIQLGLFIRDLHRNIEQLHSIQSNHEQLPAFIVYRGQGMSSVEFAKMRKSLGGLLSFNNFLSTSRDRDVSMAFAESNGNNNSDLSIIGVLFEMNINPSISSAPFAFLDDISYYDDSEQEILFSMHTIFRIDGINEIDKDNNRLWQVKLTLTDNNDQQLKALTDQMRAETEGTTEWHRMGQLLLKLGEYDKAEQLYLTLLTLSSNDIEKSFLYNQLGCVKSIQGSYQEAILYYEKTIEIYETHPFSNQFNPISYYNNIGSAYGDIGDYSKAVSFYEKALEISQNTLDPNHPDFAITYNNMASMCKNMSEYSKALLFYEKVLDIEQNHLCIDHPTLATTRRNIGLVHRAMGDYEKALSFCEAALHIHQKTLSQIHPEMAASCHAVARVWESMGEYHKALALYDKTLNIYQETLTSNHPDLAFLYNSMGSVYHSMAEYSDALSFYEKARNIWQQILPSEHLDLATSFNNIGLVYNSTGEYSKALEFFQKALDIYLNKHSSNHGSIAKSYNNMGLVYSEIGEHSKALASYEKALQIYQKCLPAEHADSLICHANVGSVYYKMGMYSTAFSYFENALKTARNVLPLNHPTLQSLINNIDIVKEKL